jgi:aminotransferase in exopolysaccharide biosynthesis
MTVPTFFVEFVKFSREMFFTQDFIPLHAPKFGGREKDFVLDALESTFVSSVGEYVNEFERKVADYTGASFAIATNNGTAALHTALQLVDVQGGDEVITVPLTFVGTCNAIRYCGADPIFVDVEWETLGLCPDQLVAFLEEHTEVRDDGLCWNLKTDRVVRACVPVHNLGRPVRIADIVSICTKHNIAVVEDAAESLGSFRDGLHTGRTGRAGILSFNGNKIITTGGGGTIITDDKVLAQRAKHRTTTSKRSHPWLFLHDEVGFNYRLPNINAALGCAQIEQLPEYVEAKRALASRYERWFDQIDAQFILESSGTYSNYWLNAVLLSNLEERDNFLKYTNDNGVMTRPIWTPMHTLSMYRNCTKGDLAVSESIESRLVNLPSSVI